MPINHPVSYDKMTPSQKGAYTRSQRSAMRTASPVGYQVAQLYLGKGWNALEISAHLGISNYQARGYMSRVSQGDFDSCRF